MYKKTLITLLFLTLTTLFYGCNRSDETTPEMAQTMLKMRGYNFTEKDFVSAVKKDDAPAVKAFLQGGMNPNAKGENGETALTAAIENSDPKIVNFLIDKADINMRDEKGNSPIHLALKKDKQEIFDALLEKNADVNVPGKSERGKDQTVLYVAVFKNDEALVKKLLDKGANPNLADSDGSYPLSEAVLGPSINTEIVKMMLDKGANPNLQETNKATPLIYISSNSQATAQARQEVVKMLLEKGADKTIKDEKGNTALYWAKKNSNKEIVELLK